MSKAQQRERVGIKITVVLLGESASPFIDEGDGLTNLGERECVCYLVLLPTLSGTRQFVGAHNTVDAQMYVAGSIVFFWYDKCWRLPCCRTNVDAHNTVRVSDMFGRLKSTLLT